MSKRKISIVYEASIDRLVEINSSFAKGVMRVAYAGKNRNRSYISKDTFESCISSIFNCPIVCNYNRETDSIGSHDVEIVKDGSGMRIVNITQPVGVVPESANYWWETIEEEDGNVHEYLCVDVILWKRQEAYEKIKNNIITDESMEITVKSGQTVDGYYHIDSFEFTAFCLLESAEPCFESACVEMFAVERFKEEFVQMLSDLKQFSISVNTSNGDDIYTKNISKGGNISMNKTDLLSQYGLSDEDIDFNIEDYSIEELKEKFEEIRRTKEGEGFSSQSQTDEPDNSESNVNTNGENGAYSLTGEQLSQALFDAVVKHETYHDSYWGDMPRYQYVDYDSNQFEVYCYDLADDWKLYGYKFSMDGDNVVIDFECKKRKKYSIVDFDEGSISSNYEYSIKNIVGLFANAKDALVSAAKDEANERYLRAENKISELNSQIEELQAYRNLQIEAERQTAVEGIFEKFSELNGLEAFEALRENCSDMELSDIESKCFEIKGRNSSLNFESYKPKAIRTPTDNYTDNGADGEDSRLYGGLFVKYPPKSNY